MAFFDPRGLADSVHDLLDRERAAILAGRFDVLERLTAEKERLIARLVGTGKLGGELERLRTLAERNARLLEAMRVGLKDATDRLEEMRRKPGSLHTYDASGRRTVLNPGQGQGKLRL